MKSFEEKVCEWLDGAEAKITEFMPKLCLGMAVLALVFSFWNCLHLIFAIGLFFISASLFDENEKEKSQNSKK